MSKYQEVEAKYPLHNAEEVFQYIERLNLEQKRINEVQHDTYYTPSHRNFLSEEIVSEWLRVRETSQKCSINYKQFLPIGAVIQNYCNEYETVIQDAYAVKKILEAMDFQIIIDVNKTRNSWIFEHVEISIDFVEVLGWYIELEAMDEVSDDAIENVYDHFNKILLMLHAKIGKRDRRGYPFLVLEKTYKGEM
ncbi:MAG: class IV adenylate cyclase [Eubacteriales bacterium]|nr:class IV adenylate cyclase [Eubacteriales bacterium]